MSTPNLPVSLNLVILPIGTTAPSGQIPASALPVPVVGPLTIPFATVLSNQVPPTGWPPPGLPGSSTPIVFLASLSQVLLTFDDPSNAGKVCQVDVLPLLTPHVAALTPQALYPGAVQAVDQFGQGSAWELTSNPFVQPGLPPAVLTHPVLLAR